MKRPVFIVFCAALLFAAVSCASRPRGSAASLGAETLEDKAARAKTAKKAQKKADKEAQKAAAIAAEKEAEAAKKAAKARVQKMEDGLAAILVEQRKGVFRLYIAGEDTKTAVISEYDEGATSGFFLKAGKAEYRLNTFGGADVKARAADNSVEMDYKVSDAASVHVEMKMMKSTSEALDDDIIRVKASVTNLKKRSDTFALKAVFDTEMEEKASGAFSTKVLSAASGKPIVKETQLFAMEKDRWVCSSDGKHSAQFLLYGADVTTPEVVTLANSEIIGLPLWTPVISGMRSFDNVMMYNNSAICINWPEARLGKGEKQDVVFYIALSARSDMPRGEEFIAALEAGMPPQTAESPQPPAQEESKEEEKPQMSAPTAGPKRDVRFDAVRDEKVDPEYMRELIRRINALENDGSNTNVEELLRLNTELDRVLDILKGKQ